MRRLNLSTLQEKKPKTKVEKLITKAHPWGKNSTDPNPFKAKALTILFSLLSNYTPLTLPHLQEVFSRSKNPNPQPLETPIEPMKTQDLRPFTYRGSIFF